MKVDFISAGRLCCCQNRVCGSSIALKKRSQWCHRGSKVISWSTAWQRRLSRQGCVYNNEVRPHQHARSGRCFFVISLQKCCTHLSKPCSCSRGSDILVDPIGKISWTSMATRPASVTTSCSSKQTQNLQ